MIEVIYVVGVIVCYVGFSIYTGYRGMHESDRLPITGVEIALASMLWPFIIAAGIFTRIGMFFAELPRLIGLFGIGEKFRK